MLRRVLSIGILVVLTNCQSWGKFWEIPSDIDVCTLSRTDIIKAEYAAAVKKYMQQQAAKGVTGDPTATTLTGPTGADFWHSGVMGTDGMIYGVPLNSTAWLRINPADDSATTAGMPTAPGGSAYSSGTLAANGKIYSPPFFPALFNQLTLSPLGVQTFSAGGFVTNAPNYTGIVMGRNYKLYAMPQDAQNFVRIDPDTMTAIVLSAVPTAGGSVTRWGGGVLAFDGKIYGIPQSYTQVLRLDPASEGADYFASLGATLDKWHGGALAANGKIYAAPMSNKGVLEIDPDASTTAEYGNYAGAEQYLGAVTAPNGKIYMIPHAATQVIEFDPETKVARVFGTLPAGATKWIGGILAGNGKIYAIPRNPVSAGQALLVIDTKSVGSFCSPLLQSAYFNKY
ncbi:MAG: hypothetical protein JNJ69_15845 [Leptospiraceae bacterium]|nr:hypothetical protein [Leptospiraceae bacterium]